MRFRRLALLLLLLTVAASLLWLAEHDGAEQGAVSISRETSMEPQVAVPVEHEPLQPRAATESEQPRAVVLNEAQEQVGSIEGFEFPRRPVWMRVRVVTESGEPCADVVVEVLALIDGASIGILRDHAPRTNDAGEAGIPAPGDWGVRIDDEDVRLAVGVPVPGGPRVAIDPEVTPSELVLLVIDERALAHTRPLPVHVVHADGAPAADFEVEWIARRMGQSGHSGRIARAKSDERGVALLSRDEWQQQQAMRAVIGGVSFEHIFRTTHAGGLAEPLVITDEARLAGNAEPLRVVVAPTGSIVIELRNHAGKPFTQPAIIRSWWLPADAGEDGRFSERGPWAHEFSAQHGGYLLTPIGLDLRVMVSAGAHDFLVAPAELVVRGPTAAGELVRASLQLGAAYPVLLARIEDASGNPLVSTTIDCATRFANSRGGGASLTVRTDENGLIRVVFRLPRETDEPRVLEWSLENPRGSNARLVMPFPDLRDVEPGAEFDLGTLRLLPEAPEPEAPPRVLLARARIINTLGQPISGAALDIYWTDLTKEERSSDLYEVEGVREADGTVRTEGVLAPDSKLSIRAHAPHYTASEWTVIQAGSEEARVLTLVASGWIAGRLLLDDEIPKDHIELVARSGRSRHDTYSGLGGRFKIRDLDAGTATLVVRNHHTRWTLLELEGIEIPAGEASLDARLQALDLRDRLLQMKLTVSRPDGTPIANEYIWISGTHGEGGGTQRTDDAGRIFVWMPREAIECNLSASGFLPARLRVATDPQTITLTPER